MNSVSIKTTSVYGNKVIRAANKQAELLAQIAGTKTLTVETIRLALQMGVPVFQDFQNGDLLRVEDLNDIVWN